MKANHPRISYNIQEDERKEFPRRCLILDLDLEFVLIYPRSQCNRAGLEFGRFRAKAENLLAILKSKRAVSFVRV